MFSPLGEKLEVTDLATESSSIASDDAQMEEMRIDCGSMLPIANCEAQAFPSPKIPCGSAAALQLS
jgi:hypothetical protein